jgi:hypothetical protein
MARTAVIAGTATAVSNNVSRRQANRWAAKEQEQQAAQPQYQEPAPQPAAPATDPYDELEKLGRLKDQGLITQSEFDSKKRQLLGL